MSEFEKVITKNQGSRPLDILLSVPTTPAQQEIISSINIDSDANLCFNESISICLKGRLSVTCLKKSLDSFLDRHDSFRSSFTPDGKKLIVYKKMDSELEYIDMSLVNDFDIDFGGLREKATKKNFDLINGPLFEFKLVKKSEQENYLLVTAHHLICDGWSMAVLVNELSVDYEAYHSQTQTSLTCKNQFYDFALNFNKQNKSKDIEYWKKRLHNTPGNTNLPLDYERGDFRTYESMRVDYQLDKNLMKVIKKISAQNRLSVYHFLFTSFNVFLSKITQQEDLVVGISTALQSRFGKYDLVGHLVQLLPVRTRVRPSMKFIDLAEAVKKEMLDAVEHSDITFGEIIQNIQIERDPAQIPLINVIFNVDQQYERQGFEFKNIDASYESNPRSFENFEIFINATTLGDSCVFECQYNKNLFKAQTIQKWLIEFESILFHFTENMNHEVSEYILKNDFSYKEIQPPKLNTPQNENNKLINQKQLELIIHEWKQILKQDNIGENDNFFNLGGHSLLAIELAQKLKKQYGFQVSIRDIMLNPTPAKICLLVDRVEKNNVPTIVSPFEPLLEFDLSYSQKQTWFIQELNKKTNMFNLPSAIRVKTEIDIIKLKAAYTLIIENHPSLRTEIIKGPKQRLIETKTVVDKIDFTPYKMNFNEAQSDMLKRAEDVIDIYRGPLFDFRLYEIDKNDFILYNNFHHIIFDGWCFDIFFRDLNDAYLGKEIQTEERSFQEFVLEKNLEVKSKDIQSQLEVFSQCIAQMSLDQSYPTDFERPTVINTKAQTINFSFSDEKIKQLNDFCRLESVSLYNVFLTAFGLALMEKNLQSEILIGTPLRARSSQRDLNTIGYYVNSLPVKISKQSNLLESLKMTQEESLVTIENENIPLELLIQHMKLKRDTSKTALFQTFFSYQDVSNRDGRFNNVQYKQVNIDKASAHTDIDMWVKANDVKIEGAIEYRIDLYSEQTIENLLKTFHLKLDLILNARASDKEDIRVEESIELEAELPVYKFLEHFAHVTPDAMAFTGTGCKLTYEELNNKVNEYAFYLDSIGIKAGDLVGVCAHRDSHLFISLFAIMKLGAGYVPLDPYFPDERLTYMINHSEIKVILSHRDLAIKERLGLDGLETIHFEDISFASMNKNFESDYDEKQSLYVIYTSGSTGLPKGVELGWRSVTNFLRSMQMNLKTNEKTRLLAVTTLSFDIAVLELYLPILSGGCIYLADKFETLDGQALWNIIQKNAINTMQATPATWRMLLSAGFKPIPKFTLLCGGEAFPRDLALDIMKLNVDVWNMYGPTETTVWSSLKLLTPPLNKITIGNPVHNTKFHILKEDGSPCDVGEVGELCISGDGLAKGYFKQNDLTNKVFLFSKELNFFIYKTGDLARELTNGEYECLGRGDSQVKIRGYRIELGEIENCLADFEQVSQTAVVVKDFSDTDRRLIAFYTSEQALSEQDFREHLMQKLPSYMIPNHFVKIKDFPLTLNGKIDKKNLKENFSLSESTAKPAINAGTTQAEKLKAIWKDLLQVDNIKMDDDFFALGGHSLLAVELFSKVEKEFQLDLELSQVINNSRFKDFLNLLTKQDLSFSKQKSLTIPNLCKSLVTIKINRTDKLLFCFHGVGGNVINYRSLRNNLADFSLIGVQSYGVISHHHNASSLEEMAKNYLEELKIVQPEGPYFLAGGSMGGTIAFEVAQQLKSQGDEVSTIIMFDTFGPNLKYKEQVSFVDRVKRGVSWRFTMYSSSLMSFFYRFIGLKVPHRYRHFHVESHNYKLMANYHVKKYDGRVDLIKAHEKSGVSYTDPYLGWENILVGEFNQYKIDGHHGNFIEAEELPNALEDILSKFTL